MSKLLVSIGLDLISKEEENHGSFRNIKLCRVKVNLMQIIFWCHVILKVLIRKFTK